MASGVEELLDVLFELVDEAKNVAFSSDKCVIERDRALDLIDDIRAQFPMELAEAKKLLAARVEYIASAKREADLIRQQAEEQAKQMLADTDIQIKDIATRLGFTSAGYFGRFFKSKLGVTPNVYRDQKRK